MGVVLQGGSPLDGVSEVVFREVLHTGGVPSEPGAVSVVGDVALARALVAAGAGRVRLFVDEGVPESLPAGVEAAELCPADVDSARAGVAPLADERTELVAGQLPKSLGALAELAETIAVSAPRARLILGARQAQLVRSMNDVLGASFAEVRASLGLRKSRALVATSPRQDARRSFPRHAHVAEFGCEVRAFGGVFAGAALDIGTRALLEVLAAGGAVADDGTGAPECVVDLGCGTGLLAVWAARQWPDARVIATDRSSAAVRSATATAAANGVGIEVVRADAGADVASGAADLVLLNPPFHDGRDVDRGMANRLFAAAARILRPGGVLLTVFNSHLRHREHLERLVGPTMQLARNAKFTVTRTQRR